MRWVILSDDWAPGLGGVATWSWGAAAGLIEAGCDVRVFVRARARLACPPGAAIHGVAPWGTRLGPALLAARSAPALLRADAVLATTWPVAEVAARLLGRRGTPLHVVFHGSDVTRPPRRPRAFALVLRATTHAWAVSGFLSDMLAPQGVQARWIPTPIAAGAPTFDRDGPWVYIARATSLKGGDRFVRLVARAGAEGVVVGDGPELPAWRRAADAVGARVRFTGALQREAVDRILDRAALVALLPRVDVDGTGAEGLGLTLLEARSRGVMPVGCRTGGVPEACALGPVLESPEDPGASVEAIRAALATWSPAMALEGLERHGPGRIAEALLA